MGLNQITSLYSEGFGPTSLQLNGAASLNGTRLRLTDGGQNETASSYYTRPVDVTRAFSTTFSFQLSPDGSAPLGAGFTFEIQNENGPATFNTLGNLDSLGVVRGPQLAIGFETIANSPYSGMQTSDNATGLYTGYLIPAFTDANQVEIPKSVIDLHSGHGFQVVLTYQPPTSGVLGSLGESILDTSTGGSWSHSYTNVDIKSLLQLNDVSGQYAYAGFTATTGGDGDPFFFGNGRSTQEILSWQWHDGSEATQAPYNANFTLTSQGMTAGAIYDANGQLVRTLWQANELSIGTYKTTWDGLDQFGNMLDTTMHPGPYRFQVVLTTGSSASYVIANDTIDPTEPSASISSLWMNGIAVSPDGSKIWAGTTDGDTAGGGFVKQFDASGNINVQATSNFPFQQIGETLAVDSGYLYEVAEVQGWTGEYGIFKTSLSNYDSQTGFTDWGHSNPDGSRVTQIGDFHYLSVISGTSGYHKLPGLVVTDPSDPNSGSLWVTDISNNLVHRYDKVTGDQIGVPLAIDHPTGIAVDSVGNIWIAHGGNGVADSISVYSSSGTFIRDVAEITGLEDVASLWIGNNKLYVADNMAGHVAVYSREGTSVTNGGNPQLIGSPATYGSDNGHTQFWNLRSVTADDQGNVYTIQETNSVGALGSQIQKWSPSGTSLWVKGGYEYQSVGGISVPGNPTEVYSSSLHRYSINPATGSWSYQGSAIYAGATTNPWTGFTNSTPASAPLGLRIGGNNFIAMPSSTGDRVVFLRVGLDGSLTPASAVGGSGLASGNDWTWNDIHGDGNPARNDILDSGVIRGPIQKMVVDQNGNIWFQSGFSYIGELPLQGVDSRGNPLYDWSKAVTVAPVPYGMVNFSVGIDGIYVLYQDARFGPESSGSVYANYSIGGANSVCKYDLSGTLRWSMPLPAYSTSLDVIPGGGVIVGSTIGRMLYQVTSAGQLVRSINPLFTSDWLDFGGSIVVTRNPNDNKIDIFIEGIGSSDTAWYRIDDSSPTLWQGTAIAGSPVTLLIPPSAPPLPQLLGSQELTTGGVVTTSVNRPSFLGTATPYDTMQLLGQTGNVITGTVADGNGRYTLTVPYSLTDGTYVFQFQTTDLAGNTSPVSQPFSVLINTSPPIEPLRPPATGASQLQASSDTGASSSDGITSITSPVFDVTATSPDLLVQLLRDGTVVAARTGSGPLADPGIVPDGVHLYTTVQVNGTNVGPASTAVLLTIITRAPVTLIPGLLAGDETGAVGSGMTSVNPPHLVGSTAANATVQIIGMRGNVVATGTSSASGRYSILLPTFSADGSYPFQARATDLAGNVGAFSPTFTVTLDTTAPVAPSKLALATSDDSGTPGDSLTNVNRPHLTGTAEPGTTVQLVGPAGVLGSTVAALNGAFSVVPTSPLPDGSIALQARAIDLAGNIGPLGPALTLIIDTTSPVAPGLPSLVLADDSGTPGDNTTTVRSPRIAGSAEAGASIALIGAGGAVLGSSVAGLNGAYVVSPSQPLPLGINSLTVVATDLAGNRSGASPTLSLTLVAPPAAPSAPALLSTDDSGTLGDGLTNVNRPHFLGTGPVNAIVRLIDAIGRTVGSGLVASNGSYSIVPTLALADGPVALTAIATDPFGNASPSSLAAAFTIDTTPPAAPSALTLFAADDSATLGDRITNNARPRLTGTAQPLATITLLDANGRLVGQAVAGTDGTFTVQPSSALAQGSITLHARATDAAGNPSADGPSLTLSILLTPPAAPTAALLSADDSGIKGDGITNVRRFRLTGTAAVGVRVQVLDATGNVVANGTASSVDGSYTLATPAASAGTFVYRVRAIDAAGNSSPPSASVSVRVLGVAGDYDGDGKADVMTYNPAQALWSIRSSSTGAVSSVGFGFAGLDVPVAADYNGTGRTILGVYRPTSSEWFLYDPTGGGVRQVQFGQPGDIPVPGDYDGIGRAEIAVYRPSTAQWLIQNPLTNTVRTVGFGWIGLDQPMPADYDGAGRLQIAVYRPPFADWFILHVDGTTTMTQFGPSYDIAVPADYDGDGKADIAVYHPQTAQWFVLQSSNGLTTATQCGQAGVDQPVPADYDGVGRVNFANYRSPVATFFIRSNLDTSRSTPILGTANASQAVLTPLAFRLKGVALLPVAQAPVWNGR